MFGDFAVYGVYIPTLLGLMLLAFLVQNGVHALLLKANAYRYVWHPPLFNLAMYVLVLGTLFALLRKVRA